MNLTHGGTAAYATALNMWRVDFVDYTNEVEAFIIIRLIFDLILVYIRMCS